MLNVSAPGNFEENMPGIAQWFIERSPDDTCVRQEAAGRPAQRRTR